jgi:PTS system mannose-specific IIC component
MFSVMQILLLSLVAFVLTWDTWNTQTWVYGRPVICGFLAGLITGDMVTGLKIGATMQLMSLGIGGYGASSVPNYDVGAIVGTAFAVATGKGLEVGLAAGIPTAALGVQLDVLGKMAGSFFLHRAQSASEKLETKKMYRWIFTGSIIRPGLIALAVFIVLTAGANTVQFLLDNMPKWLISGLNVAGGILPAVGFAILLRYMPFRKHFIFVIMGFVLAAYLNVPIIGIALLAFIAAYIFYTGIQKKETVTGSNTTVTAAEEGGNYDE